ncbi:hypothetical protein G6Z90_16965 [Vibrio aestuarianus subsp. cardii]|uniref:hypothetical protein n=1 Tax=Vibrio aestuarianus TaxID=28171 RepID=UPI0015939D13|nr:hypothetical protein [Vibrio aestuarianus]MDE1312559.1 hypothetical protein [Vibrio aestuarianus]NGZ94151.1 hypothetical protein [Vibrio aestuarianus subsp. cardii]
MENTDNVVDMQQQDKDQLIKRLEQKIVELESSETEQLEEKKRQHFIRQAELKNDRVKATVIGSIFILCLTILIFLSLRNPDIYLIESETTSFIAQAVNAFFLLMIPLIIGSIGAIARIMVSGMPILRNSTLILSSGLMAMFSWVGIKSEILVSIIAPHLEQQGVSVTEVAANSSAEFYSMVLVAIIVGMFSSNVYIFINQKVEALTNARQP